MAAAKGQGSAGRPVNLNAAAVVGKVAGVVALTMRVNVSSLSVADRRALFVALLSDPDVVTDQNVASAVASACKWEDR